MDKPCEIKKGLRNHFTTLAKFRNPREISQTPMQIPKAYAKTPRVTSHIFKALHSLFSFRTPHLFIVKTSINLRRPNFHRFSLRWTPHAHASEEATRTESVEHRNESFTPILIWRTHEEAILTLHWLGIRHLRPSRPRAFHYLRVEYLLVHLSADTRHGDHGLHPWQLLYALRVQHSG